MLITKPREELVQTSPNRHWLDAGKSEESCAAKGGPEVIALQLQGEGSKKDSNVLDKVKGQQQPPKKGHTALQNHSVNVVESNTHQTDVHLPQM